MDRYFTRVLVHVQDSTVDGRNPAPPKTPWLKPITFVDIYVGDHIILLLLNGGAKWISSVQYEKEINQRHPPFLGPLKERQSICWEFRPSTVVCGIGTSGRS